MARTLGTRVLGTRRHGLLAGRARAAAAGKTLIAVRLASRADGLLSLRLLLRRRRRGRRGRRGALRTRVTPVGDEPRVGIRRRRCGGRATTRPEGGSLCRSHVLE